MQRNKSAAPTTSSGNSTRRPLLSGLRREERAVELGPAELMVLLEWALRNRPRAVRNVRRSYREFCVALYRRLERARCSQ